MTVWRRSLIFFRCSCSSSSSPCICHLCRKSACVYVGPSWAMYAVLWVKMSVSIPTPHCFNCYNSVSYFYWGYMYHKIYLVKYKIWYIPKIEQLQSLSNSRTLSSPPKETIFTIVVTPCFPLNPSSWQPLTFYLYRFSHSGHFISKESYNRWSFLFDLFLLAFFKLYPCRLYSFCG